jgi:hypothetical protein
MKLREGWSQVKTATIQSRSCLSSCLLSKNVKTRIYKSIILPLVLYGCETWSDIKDVWEQGAQQYILTEERQKLHEEELQN